MIILVPPQCHDPRLRFTRHSGVHVEVWLPISIILDVLWIDLQYDAMARSCACYAHFRSGHP